MSQLQTVQPWRRCGRCTQLRAPDDFAVKASKRSGRAGVCLDCQEALRREKCPTPTKRCHETREEAAEHIRSLYVHGRGNPDLQPYECACKVWHVGHSKAHLGLRIRQSLKGTGRRRR